MRTVEKEIGTILSGKISSITQRSIFNRLGPLASKQLHELTPADKATIMAEMENSIRLFARQDAPQLIDAIAKLLSGDASSTPSVAGATSAAGTPGPKKLAIALEKDIATARLEAWSEAVRIGLSKFASVKVATAVSELARNIVFYAGTGTVELRFLKDDRGLTGLQIVAADQGPGIPPEKLEEIWAGTYKSQRGMGKGLVAVKKLVDEFHLETRPGVGTTVTCLFRGER